MTQLKSLLQVLATLTVLAALTLLNGAIVQAQPVILTATYNYTLTKVTGGKTTHEDSVIQVERNDNTVRITHATTDSLLNDYRFKETFFYTDDWTLEFLENCQLKSGTDYKPLSASSPSLWSRPINSIYYFQSCVLSQDLNPVENVLIAGLDPHKLFNTKSWKGSRPEERVTSTFSDGLFIKGLNSEGICDLTFDGSRIKQVAISDAKKEFTETYIVAGYRQVGGTEIPVDLRYDYRDNDGNTQTARLALQGASGTCAELKAVLPPTKVVNDYRLNGPDLTLMRMSLQPIPQFVNYYWSGTPCSLDQLRHSKNGFVSTQPDKQQSRTFTSIVMIAVSVLAGCCIRLAVLFRRRRATALS